jgi:hypothetical protein
MSMCCLGKSAERRAPRASPQRFFLPVPQRDCGFTSAAIRAPMRQRSTHPWIFTMLAIVIILAWLAFLLFAAAFARKYPVPIILVGIATIAFPWIAYGNLFKIDGLAILILCLIYGACLVGGLALVKLGWAGLTGDVDETLQDILDKTKP